MKQKKGKGCLWSRFWRNTVLEGRDFSREEGFSVGLHFPSFKGQMNSDSKPSRMRNPECFDQKSPECSEDFLKIKESEGFPLLVKIIRELRAVEEDPRRLGEQKIDLFCGTSEANL